MKLTRRTLLGWAAGALAALGIKRVGRAEMFWKGAFPGRALDVPSEMPYRYFRYWDDVGDWLQGKPAKDMAVLVRPERTRWWRHCPLVPLNYRIVEVAEGVAVAVLLEPNGTWRYWPRSEFKNDGMYVRLGERLDEMKPENYAGVHLS